uniref:Uncharacterized protein LOC111103506 n=1 Tax=Crassostrea virginica TaxID=6565 RepID=A0A8B8AMW5_CRAVI|nr:uncharacterized protein LOC111103506 [Crassostrea virginica]
MCSFDTGCPGTGIMSTPMDKNIIRTSSRTHDLSFTNRKQSHVFFTTKSTKLNLKEIADNGLSNCDEKKEQRYRFDLQASVIGLTAISGVFLVLYIGLHLFINLKSKNESPYPVQLNA